MALRHFRVEQKTNPLLWIGCTVTAPQLKHPATVLKIESGTFGNMAVCGWFESLTLFKYSIFAIDKLIYIDTLFDNENLGMATAVKLRSGGPRMTIRHVSDKSNEAICIWKSRTGITLRKVFPLDALCIADK